MSRVNLRHLWIVLAAIAVAVLPRDLAFPIFVLSLMGAFDRLLILSSRVRWHGRVRMVS